MNATIAKKLAAKVTVTTLDGVVLDSFVLTHWKNELPDMDQDQESFGSPASNSSLTYRLQRDVEVVLPDTLKSLG